MKYEAVNVFKKKNQSEAPGHLDFLLKQSDVKKEKSMEDEINFFLLLYTLVIQGFSFLLFFKIFPTFIIWHFPTLYISCLFQLGTL